MYILPPGSDHYYYSSEENPWEKMWFNAEGIMTRVLLYYYNKDNKIVFENANGRKYIERIHEIAKNQELSNCEKHQKAEIIFHELLQFLSEKSFSKHERNEINVITEYINNHISENISVQNLADMVFLSKSRLIKIFKENTGKTPYEYILDKKLERAVLMLSSSNIMVKEVAFSLGFSDEHYFSSLFKRKMGYTPKKYRYSADKSIDTKKK